MNFGSNHILVSAVNTQNNFPVIEFYKSYWFIPLFGICLIITILILLYLARRSLKQKNRQLFQLNHSIETRMEKYRQLAESEVSDTKEQAEELQKTKLAMLNILEDVQEDNQKLSAYDERFQLATRAARFGIWEIDITTQAVIWDEQMYELNNVSRDKFHVNLQNWNELIAEDDRKLREEAFKKAITTGKEQNITYKITWPNGEVHYLNSYITVEKNTEGKPVRLIGAILDVTQEKEIDKAKTEFVSLAAHQLRTPLTAIKWYTERLQNTQNTFTADQKKDLEQVAESAQRVIRLVGDLLNVSRLDLGTFSVEPKPNSVVKLVQKIVADLKPLYTQKKLKVSEKYTTGLEKVKLDEEIFRIIIENLLSNSIKYTPENGKIEVSVSKDSNKFSIIVKDNGYGIPKNQQSKIFSKLFRADNVVSKSTEGTGLGLYMVKSIVDQVGGKISFTSEENKGTAFKVDLPLTGMKEKTGSKRLG